MTLANELKFSEIEALERRIEELEEGIALERIEELERLISEQQKLIAALEDAITRPVPQGAAP